MRRKSQHFDTETKCWRRSEAKLENCPRSTHLCREYAPFLGQLRYQSFETNSYAAYEYLLAELNKRHGAWLRIEVNRRPPLVDFVADSFSGPVIEVAQLAATQTIAVVH